MTCGRTASAVGIDSDERALGNHPITIHGGSTLERYWFSNVADTAEWTRGAESPSESGIARSRSKIEERAA